MIFTLDCWDLWKSSGSNTDRQNRESFKCFDAVLASLVALLQDTHTYRDMNVDILKQIDVMKKLSFAMKNDLMTDDSIFTYEVNVVPTIIELFAGLVGSPPDLHVISELMQIALFLQDVANNYIHHSRLRMNRKMGKWLKMIEGIIQVIVPSILSIIAICSKIS